MNKKIKKIVFSALFAGLIFCATFFLKFNMPLGYVHFGDCLVLTAAWMLGPIYGTLAAAIGSMLADLIGGYPQYMIATFIIKGFMAFVAWCVFRYLGKRRVTIPYIAISGVIGTVVMVAGYYLTESVFLAYGFAGALAAVVPNIVQGLFGAVSATLLIKIMSKNRYLGEYFK